MGTWGTNILENDAAMDVYGQFEDIYYERKDLNDIKISIQQSYGLFNKNNKPVLEDNTNRWLAYALICWECQVLDKETLEFVDQILEQKIDADSWEDLWDKRRKAIEQLRKKLAVPSKKLKTIPKFFKLLPPFEAGDCLAFKYEDGMYGGAICTAIVTDHKKTEYHTWHFAYINWHSENKPKPELFYQSYFLIGKYASQNLPYHTYLQDSMHYAFTGGIREAEEYKKRKNEMDKMEVIGKLKMKEPVTARGGNMCFDLGRWKLNDLFDLEKPNHDFPVKKFCELL